jgi:hypothetical protein
LLAALIIASRAASTDDLARAVEAETIARVRRLDTAEIPDVASYRTANPEVDSYVQTRRLEVRCRRSARHHGGLGDSQGTGFNLCAPARDCRLPSTWDHLAPVTAG